MSYTIIKTDGTTLGTIADGTVNTSFTSLTLIGRNYANYGQIIADDLVKLVENFSYTSPPTNPLAGQLWWDSYYKRLKVYTGTAFKVISSATVDTAPPTGAISGDLWFHSGDKQLFIYDGANWILVGPQFNNSGAIWEQISDGTINHPVLSIKLGNVRTSIVSLDSDFTPSPSILGFATIKQGLTANSSVNSGTFFATANNANYLGQQPASNYLRTDIDSSTLGNLTIAKNGGLTVGLSSNLQITTDTTGNVSIKNTKSNGDINFYSNVGGTNTLSFGIDGATGTAALLSATLSGSLTLASGATVTGALNVTGTGAFSGNLTAPTQSAGTADTTVATTAWVINNSGFLKNKIYSGTTEPLADTFIEVNKVNGATAANIIVRVGGIDIATASNVGFNLLASGIATTPAVPALTAYHQYYANTAGQLGNARIATAQYVGTATQYWSGSAKFVSTEEPDAAVGKNGDFWFQREA